MVPRCAALVLALSACVQTQHPLPSRTVDAGLDLTGTWVCDGVGQPDVYRVTEGPRQWSVTNEDDEVLRFTVHRLKHRHVLQVAPSGSESPYWTVLGLEVSGERAVLRSLDLSDDGDWVAEHPGLMAQPDGSLLTSLPKGELAKSLGQPTWFGRPLETSSSCVRSSGAPKTSPRGAASDG